MRFILLALLMFMWASPAPALVEKTPTQTVSQQQFYQELREAKTEAEWLSAVNRFVNHTMTYKTDDENYKIPDMWVMGSTTGDCEDYALNKLFVLNQLGWPFSRMRIALVYVPPKPGDPYIDGAANHATLEVRLSDGQVVLMDNNADFLVDKKKVESIYGWRFVWDWH